MVATAVYSGLSRTFYWMIVAGRSWEWVSMPSDFHFGVRSMLGGMVAINIE